MGSLFLRDRRRYATAPITKAKPITITKIISIVIGFPFPSFPWAERQLPRPESANSLLKKLPVSCGRSDLLEFEFGPEPIVNLVAWEVAALSIDLICATPDFFVTWCGAC